VNLQNARCNDKNKNKYNETCVLVHKIYVPLIFLTGHRETGLHVNVITDNIQIDIKEIALMTAWTEINLKNI
jgi:hypothetical protein